MSFHVPVEPQNLPSLVRERLADQAYRTNVLRATELSLAKRARVVTDYRDWENMREAAHRIKKLVMDHLPAYLREFESRARDAGAEVLYADDAVEARRIVVDICRSHEAHLVVKSKSMVTEEIHLAPKLTAAGIETLETDLGEYIVQLAGEIPSHITAPALHKSRQDIGRLFQQRLGVEYTEDPEQLTAIARRVLREKFLRADVGISGVNFAVADTGAICIVENEGNARLSISLPRVHIAVMGMEKLLPDTASLSLFLKMLARSATGQRMTSYTSLIRGPRRNGEQDGPEKLYIVILDNGRARMLKHPELREVLYCVRCGACLNTCPVYQLIGGHGYGSVYSGPIGAVITPALEGWAEAPYHPFVSSLCGACTDICPVKIDLHHLLLRQRGNAVREKRTPSLERFLVRGWRLIMQSPALYQLAGRIMRFLAPLASDKGGNLVVPRWSVQRAFPSPPRKTFKDLWRGKEGQT